jgi:RimJ/RimL family protein N-acetyltransferase
LISRAARGLTYPPRRAGQMTLATDDEIARGERVRLRRKKIDDAPLDYAWRRDPELARFDAAAPLRSSYTDFLSTFREDVEYPTPFRRVYAIDELGGQHIGNVMYYNIDDRRKEAELGITIGDKRFWSRGYGRDVLQTFLRHLFTDGGLQRVYLNTLDWNVRAQQSFLAAGFVQCGTMRRGVHNFITMEALRDEWLASHPSPEPED